MHPSLLLLFPFFLLFSFVSSFNITKILNQYSDFGNFNDLLSQTRLSQAINNRRTITVLAVDDGNIAQINGFSSAVKKEVLSLHIVLDYYDMAKLKKLQKKYTILTTLFQSSGQASKQQGFLNVTNDNGSIRFGSAVKGSGLNANLVGSVTSQPYNISVLQVSTLILPYGLDTNKQTPPPAKEPAPAEAPEPSEPPSKAPTPDADSSMSSPPAVDGPNADGPAADSPKGGASGIGGTRSYVIGLMGIGMVMLFGWGW